jgi:type II secretion system protein N
LKKVLLLLVAVIAVVWGLWVAFPVTAMESMIEDSVQNQDIVVAVEGLQKGFFYHLYADKIALKRTTADLIALNAVRATINPFRLAMMRMDLSAHGHIGEGSFSGDASLSKNEVTAELDFMEARITDIPFLATTGIRGKGTISGHLTLTGQKGHGQFLVKEAELEPMIFQGVPAPLNFFRTVHGSLDIDRNTIHVASVLLEGPDILARLKGIIKDGVADLRMEVMPRKSFLENPLFLSQVDRYQVSPGYYVIPIKGPIAF